MHELSKPELDDIYEFAVGLGKEAGKMLLEAAKIRMGNSGSQEQKEHVQKENAVDLVTETDEGNEHEPFRLEEGVASSGGDILS